jgi:hypothetical protein
MATKRHFFYQRSYRVCQQKETTVPKYKVYLKIEIEAENESEASLAVVDYLHTTNELHVHVCDESGAYIGSHELRKVEEMVH